MMIDIRFRSFRTDQCHIVKWSHQYTSVECEEMQVTIKLKIDGCMGFSAVFRWFGTKPILGAITKTFDNPWQFKFFDNFFNASSKPLLEIYSFDIKHSG